MKLQAEISKEEILSFAVIIIPISIVIVLMIRGLI